MTSTHSRRTQLNLRPGAALLGSTILLFVCGLLVAGASGASETDWRQWRGPNFDGTSAETGLPLVFGDDQNLIWKSAMVGRSGSTPIVVGDRLFLTAALEDDSLEAWALDANDGKVLWKRSLGGGNYFRMKHNMSSPSPVSDGETVWMMAGTGVLKAFDLNGAQIWERSLQDDYGAFGLNHGYGASPLLADGVLYIPVLHGMTTDEPSYVLALDASSGKTKWKVDRPTDALMESPDAYTTPVLWKHGGQVELVITGGDYATGHDLADGKELWRVDGMNPDKAKMYRVVASPVVAGDMLMVPSRVRPLMGLKSVGASKAPAVAWKIEKATDVPTPAIKDGLLYVLTDRGMVSVFEVESGDLVYGPKRIETGTYSASPLIADGRLYAVSEESVVTVVALGREFKVLAVNNLEGYSLSSPIAANGRLFLRTDKFLYCVGTE